jgi:hypothetical protein
MIRNQVSIQLCVFFKVALRSFRAACRARPSSSAAQQEATGRVKGTIRAGHVKLQNGGAVEDFIVS